MCILSPLFHHESNSEKTFLLFRPVIQHQYKTATSITDDHVAHSNANSVRGDVQRVQRDHFRLKTVH